MRPVRPNWLLGSGYDGGSSGLFGGLGDQTLHRGGRLSAHTTPVGQAILCNADAFFGSSGDGVVKTDTLNEASITACALVSHKSRVETRN